MCYATGPPAANKRPEMSGQEEQHNSRKEPEGGGGDNTAKYQLKTTVTDAIFEQITVRRITNRHGGATGFVIVFYSQVEDADGDGFQPRFAAAPWLSHRQHGGSLQAGARKASWVKERKGTCARLSGECRAQSFVMRARALCL